MSNILDEMRNHNFYDDYYTIVVIRRTLEWKIQLSFRFYNGIPHIYVHLINNETDSLRFHIGISYRNSKLMRCKWIANYISNSLQKTGLIIYDKEPGKYIYKNDKLIREIV